jgi:hypothetical protein
MRCRRFAPVGHTRSDYCVFAPSVPIPYQNPRLLHVTSCGDRLEVPNWNFKFGSPRASLRSVGLLCSCQWVPAVTATSWPPSATSTWRTLSLGWSGSAAANEHGYLNTVTSGGLATVLPLTTKRFKNSPIKGNRVRCPRRLGHFFLLKCWALVQPVTEPVPASAS